MNIKGFADVIFVPIILGVFFSIIAGGHFYFKHQFNKNLVSLESYNGEFKEVLNKGVEYLEANNKKVKYDVSIIENGFELTTEVVPGMFRPKIILNTRDINNNGWIKDFNLIADIYELPRLENTKDHALFLLGHEYRHVQQWNGLVKDYKVLNKEHVQYKNVVDYHKQVKESDADWFGLNFVKEFKGL